MRHTLGLVRARGRSLVFALLYAGCVDLGSAPAPDADLALEAGDDASPIDAADAGPIDAADVFMEDLGSIDAFAPDAAEPCIEGVTTSTIGATVVRIDSSDVDQRTIAIHSGEIVLWVNGDEMSHRMASGTPAVRILVEDGGFDTGTIRSGRTMGWRFCTPRSFAYFCTTHPGTMRDYQLEILP